MRWRSFGAVETSLLRRTQTGVDNCGAQDGDCKWSKVGHDERAYSTHELIRTTQQLSPIQADDSKHDRQERPAAPSDSGTEATAAAGANGQAGLSLPNTPSEPSLSDLQSGSATQIPRGAHHPEADRQTGCGDESLTISSLTVGAVAAAAAQPGITFELRVRSCVLVTTTFYLSTGGWLLHALVHSILSHTWLQRIISFVCIGRRRAKRGATQG